MTTPVNEVFESKPFREDKKVLVEKKVMAEADPVIVPKVSPIKSEQKIIK